MAFSGPTFRILIPTLIISLGGSFHYGYELTILNPSEDAFKSFLNSSFQAHFGTILTTEKLTYLWPFVTCSQLLGCFVGTLFIKLVSERVGRRKGFYLTNSGFILACIPQGCSKYLNSWELLVIGRFLMGVTSGCHLGLQPMYFNEICPKSRRGLIGGMTGVTVTAGFVLGSVIALPKFLGDTSRWPYLFLVEVIVSIPALCILPFLPESPKYLASIGDRDGAEKSLRFFGRSEAEVKVELDEIERELSSGTSRSMSVKELFQTPHIRKGVLLGWTTVLASSFSGIIAISYFSTALLRANGLSLEIAQYATVGVASPCLLGVALGSLLVDKIGRRPMIICANIVILILNILFIVFAHLTRVYAIGWTSVASIVVIALISFVFGFGPSLILWMITAELVPQRARSTAQTLAMLAQWTFLGCASALIMPLQNMINEFCFLIHIVPLGFSVVCFLLVLPETKNKSTLEVMEQLGYVGEGQEKESTRDSSELEMAEVAF